MKKTMWICGASAAVLLSSGCGMLQQGLEGLAAGITKDGAPSAILDGAMFIGPNGELVLTTQKPLTGNLKFAVIMDAPTAARAGVDVQPGEILLGGQTVEANTPSPAIGNFDSDVALRDIKARRVAGAKKPLNQELTVEWQDETIATFIVQSVGDCWRPATIIRPDGTVEAGWDINRKIRHGANGRPWFLKLSANQLAVGEPPLPPCDWSGQVTGWTTDNKRDQTDVDGVPVYVARCLGDPVLGGLISSSPIVAIKSKVTYQ